MAKFEQAIKKIVSSAAGKWTSKKDQHWQRFHDRKKVCNKQTS